MLITLAQLYHLGSVDKVIIHSIDMSLYQLSVELDGKEFYVTDNKGKLLRAFNTLQLQKQVRSIEVKKMLLRHTSAYDEMIGLAEPHKHNSNMLEVEICDNDLN